MTIVTLGLGFFLRACVQLIFGSHTYSFFLDLPDITLEIGRAPFSVRSHLGRDALL